MSRLFVALVPPQDVVERLCALTGGVPGARWQSPDQIHLTLRFIGETCASTQRDIEDALAPVDLAPFDLTLSGVGHFGDKRRPRVIWAGVEPSPSLCRLQEKIERALVMAGLPPATQKFHPHVTLARLKGASMTHVGRFLAANSPFRSRSFRIDGFSLFSSELGAGGACYFPEADYLFSDAPARAEADAGWDSSPPWSAPQGVS